MRGTETDSPLRQMTILNTGYCGKARCEPGWEWHPPALNDFDLWYVVAGSGDMRLNGATYPVSKGTCFVLRPGDRPHATQHPDDRLTVIFIHFTARDMCSGMDWDPGLSPERYTLLTDTYEFEAMLERILESRERGERWAADEFDCRIKLALLHLYRLQISRDQPPAFSLKQQHAISKVIARIREEGGRRIAYEELAAAVGLAPSYLSVLFKKMTGLSLKAYITKVRMERAMHLLTETTMNVSQVSDALDYANVPLFSKQFKEYFGQPPSHFHLRAVSAKSHHAGSKRP